MRGHGSHGRWTWALTALGVACAAVLLAGCSPPGNTAPQTEATVTPEATSTAAVEPTVSPEPTETPAVQPTVAPDPPSTLPYKPGPNETGKNFAWLKKLVLEDGYVYATVDYILIGEGDDGWFITNNNPKLRTFPLKQTCPCRYLVEGGANLSGALAPNAFMTKWQNASASKMIRKNPYEVTVKNGVITKLDNEWLP